MDRAAAQELWNTLCSAIGEIYNQNASTLSYEELYRFAYNLVIHKHSEFLYDGVKNAIRDHLTVSLIKISEAKDDQIISEIVKCWSFHSIAFDKIRDIMMYMDRTYCLPRKKPPVFVFSRQLFRECILYEPALRDRVRAIILQEILLERQGRVIDRPLLKSYLAMLVDLGVDGVKVYDEEFERFFLDETKSFYKVESLAFISENTCPDYVIKAEARLWEEHARVRNYLAASTENKLRHVAEHELIAEHSKTLLNMENTGFTCMLRDNKLPDLQRMYAIFARIPLCLEQLRDSMFRYVKQVGIDIVASQETSKDPVAFVRAILDLKSKFDTIISSSFRAEKAVQKKLNEAFEGFINIGNHCAAHLASYVDELLRGGIQGASEMEVEDKLDKVIVIFKFLSDKDIFESYYKTLLCKRLLGGKTVSDEIEKQMIAKFKAECGYQFTTKLEGMFLDMNISKGVQEEFRASPVYHTTAVPIDVHVLTTGYWPLTPSPPCRLPAALQQSTTQFSSFYLGLNSGRKLTWLTHLGSVDMKANFKSGKKELNVSLYQMCILVLFNDQETLSLESIRIATQIPEQEFKRHLLSLCTPKLKILRKHSKGKGIEADDSFTFNDEFTSKFKRIKVPLVSAREVSPQEGGAGDGAATSGVGGDGDNLPAAVEEERRHHVEAAIVRIMKARKTLSHNELVMETTRQLAVRFTPTPQFIKRRVESLIEREYLQRDKDDARSYQYLA